MRADVSPPTTTTLRRTRLFRVFEIIPGAVLWLTFLLGLVFSFVRPLWVILFMVCFSFYWLLRVIYFIVYVTVAWRRFRVESRLDWFARLQAEVPAHEWEQIHHLVFLPTVHESAEVLQQTFRALAASAYPKDRCTIVLAGEERAGHDAFLERARRICEEFGNVFDILITVHPRDLPDEVVGKGSNLHYAGPRAVAHLDARGIPRERVIVSAFDVDTVVHPQYFACLTWTFVHHPNRLRTSYQPVALYSNNMWESPPFLRVAAFGTTFWLLTELVRPDRLFTFSSHAMPLPALIDVGFWEKDIVTEDSRIFLQGFIRYDGAYTVTPLFIPVAMHTAKADTIWGSMVNLYKQQRRWAWGVEHFPYMCWHFFLGSGRSIAFMKKVKYLWNLSEGMYSWASAPILLFLFSRLPLSVIRGSEAETTVLAQTAPFVLQWLLGVGMLGIFVSALLSIPLMPPRPGGRHPLMVVMLLLQWALLPVTLLLFGAIPAVEAQTRLLLAKYLGFYVAAKSK
ncbi:glycosyltransferase family 2 protein [Candidatus Uhrbacteria bacterium]|nr:glycosyltransferase family 2 protein [Candidatus Uhrbacteria bacterium]